MGNSKKIQIPLLIGGLVLIVTIGAGVTFAIVNNQNQSNVGSTQLENNITNTGNNSNQVTSQPNNSVNKNYKDGTYTSNGTYSTPDGDESLSATVTIENDIIRSVTAVSEAKDRTSKQYSALFIRGISGIAVGKDISTFFSPTNVNGSSLTVKGFDKALELIRIQAEI